MMPESSASSFVATRGELRISGHLAKIENGNVYVALDPPFQYVCGWEPMDGGDPVERGRSAFDELATTWAWILGTPEVLVERVALEAELAATPWLVSNTELGHRLGACFDDQAQLRPDAADYQAITEAWSGVAAFGEHVQEQRIYEIANRLGCPHPDRLCQMWILLDFAPNSLEPDD